MPWLILAAALCTAPVRGAVRDSAPPLEVVNLPPLLIKDLSDPANPLLPALALHADALLPLASRGEREAEYLRPLMSSPQTIALEKLAAGILTRVASERDAVTPLVAAQQGLPSPLVASLDRLRRANRSWLGRYREPQPGLAQLAEAARADAAVAAVFDGAPKFSDLKLDGLAYGGGELYLRGAKVRNLGVGAFGTVFEHPAIVGAVIKVAHRSAHRGVDFEEEDWSDPMMARFDPNEVADREEDVARKLSRHGTGPRHFGRAVLNGHHARVSERVYGETIRDLILRGAFGPVEHAFIEALLDRLVPARLHPGDMKLANLMIGSTLLNRVHRAFLVDGGWFLKVPEDMTDDRMRHRLRYAGMNVESDEPHPEEGERQLLGPVLLKGLKP